MVGRFRPRPRVQRRDYGEEMSWLGRSRPPREDPSVALVEDILEAAACRTPGAAPQRDGRLVVHHAIWLCACETMDDSPVWLIYDVGEDGVGWQRLPDPKRPADVVEAELLTGGHPDPHGVLEWLRGDARDPWSGWQADFPEHSFVYEAMRKRIHSRGVSDPPKPLR